MDAPLAGLRVLEVANWVAGPSAGVLLADLGADVVKVEPPSGDAARRMLRQPKPDDPALKAVDYPFEQDNRGKRSLVVAIDKPEGAAFLARIAGRFDVFLTNLVPERQRRFGLDPATMLAAHPRLIHASVSGYGSDGPDAHLPGFDVTAFFSRGGVYALTAGEDGEPRRLGAAQGDHTTGMVLFSAIMTALYQRDRTGKGMAVETSLLRSALWTLATDLSAALVDHKPPPRPDRGKFLSPFLNSFRCGDGRWVQFSMPNSDTNWARFCRALDRPDLIDDPRFADNRGRYRNQLALLDEVDPVLDQRPRSEWGERFDAEGLIWAPVNDLADVVEDPHLRATGAFATVEHPAVGSFETTNVPFTFHGADVGVRGRAPEVGQHTTAVLDELGIDADEQAALRRAGVFG
ncbi:MAG: CaiB/BaiF CoA transferase family protein [Acidimicrobiia bacterium]